MTKFERWIRQRGIKKTAQDLHITEHGVRAWLRREAMPQFKNLDALVRLSRGGLSFQDIVEATTQPTRSLTKTREKRA